MAKLHTFAGVKEHKVVCAICCCGPMLMLLILGAMRLTIMVLIAALIAIEKLAPKPELVIRLSGSAVIMVGLIMLFRPAWFP